MKINEIILENDQNLNEGPIDFLRKVGRGLAGLATGAGFGAGYAAKAGEIEQSKIVKDMIKNAMADWSQYKRAKETSSGTKVTPNEAVDWAKSYFQSTGEINPRTGMPGGKLYEITTSPTGTSDSEIKQWLEKEINKNFAATLTQTPAKPVERPDFVEKLAPIPPDGSIVKSRTGDYKVVAGQWQDPKNNVITDNEIVQILNNRYEELNSLRGLTPFPKADITLNTTNGEYVYSVATGINWIQVSDAAGNRLSPSRTVTNRAEVEQLNKIAAQQGRP